MGFASTYLEKREIFPEFISEAPDKQTGIIVVVPSYNEPGICELLDSLAISIKPACAVEVMIIINAPADATQEDIWNNELSLKNIESWKKKNKNCFFRLFVFMAGQPSIKGWGVGLARKTGMDEALRRFNNINMPEGVILSLDADCRVEKNYFVSVFDELLTRRDRSACSIYFEHPLSGSDFPPNVYSAITLYELHLRYYFQGLAYSGFPYVFHTVGSASAVKALPYVKAGGMNRKQAGEDFYFIQKLVPAGGYFNLNSTIVYPSPRASFRVPFGTGASIGKLVDKNIHTLLTYNMQAFKELRIFFGMVCDFYHSTREELSRFHKLFPPALKSFINEEEWREKITEIKDNTSEPDSFKKRFFAWFNMFRIVKYLNYTHQDLFEKRPVDVSASELLVCAGIDFTSNEPLELLHFYRSLEKNSVWG